MHVDSQLVDVVLGFMVVEWILLTLYRVWMRRGLSAVDLAVNLAAGAGLLLAMRGSITGAHPFWIMGCLLAAGVAHAIDLSRRWRNKVEGAGIA